MTFYSILDELIPDLARRLGVTEDAVNEVFADLYHRSHSRSVNGAMADAIRRLPTEARTRLTVTITI